MSVYQKLLKTREEKGAGFLVLLDPDRLEIEEIVKLARKSEKGGADGFLVGSSLLLSSRFDESIKQIRSNVDLPVIIFPGNANQVSKYADAILFLSLISGRNPHLLIGEQVKAAPMIKEFGLEPIPTGYLIIESGKATSVQFMSDTQPIPKDKPDIAKAHALAAEYLGMRFVFLEAGSGAENPVPDLVIREIRDFISIPLIVGGGIKKPDAAYRKVKCGASFVVIGNALEKDDSILKEFAEAIHFKTKSEFAKKPVGWGNPHPDPNEGQKWGTHNQHRKEEMLMKESEWIRTHLEEIVEKYAGNYIAVVGQKVVSSNKSGVEAEKEARDKYPDKMPMVFRVPREEDFNCLL